VAAKTCSAKRLNRHQRAPKITFCAHEDLVLALRRRFQRTPKATGGHAMLFLRFLLFVISFGFVGIAIAVVLYDVYLAFELDRVLRRSNDESAPAPLLGTESPVGEQLPPVNPAVSTPRVSLRRNPNRVIRWASAAKILLIAAALGIFGRSILVVPDGHAAIRISQISGVRPGTLYAGTHLITPLIERAELYDIRDKVFSTAATENSRDKGLEILTVEAREGLSVGLAVTVRYRLDPRHLDYIQANLPQPIDEQIVAPVVTSVFRELGPNYVIRDVFSTKREEFRAHATQLITARLAEDQIVVKEVLLRKVQLPEEYSAGLQGLLLKEQEDDRVTVDQSIEQKKVKIAESQAEAQKVRQIKHAEADARTRVLMAQAESDSMQYTLPLKQKQIEQSKLEAEARKQTTIEDADAAAQARVKNADAEAQAKIIDSKAEQQRRGFLAAAQNEETIKGAEAAAQAKVIDGKAEKERQTLLADAEANQIRVTSQANAEKLQLEAAALKINPMLVQLTVAQRLSDRVQIMMVPNDGKFFFTNDVMKSAQVMSNMSPGTNGK
jgi:regulator of protease activity HflC (stomatin/prohibitin superfamily)